MRARYARQIREGIALARMDSRRSIRALLFQRTSELTFTAYTRTFRRDFMASGGCKRWEY